MKNSRSDRISSCSGFLLSGSLFLLLLAGCSGGEPEAGGQVESAAAEEAAAESAQPEPGPVAAVAANENELPTWKIPNIPKAAEAYYAPDNLHVIAQTQDPDALVAEGRETGALTYTFTDQGTDIRRINDHGQDACSYFLPEAAA